MFWGEEKFPGQKYFRWELSQYKNSPAYIWCPVLSLLNRPCSLKGFRNLLNLPFPDIMRKSMCLAFRNACESRIIQQECAVISGNEMARTCSSTQNQRWFTDKTMLNYCPGPSIFCVFKNKLRHFGRGSFCSCEWYSREHRMSAPLQLRPWEWEGKSMYFNKTSVSFHVENIFYLFKH